jgi:hypothetical protein
MNGDGADAVGSHGGHGSRRAAMVGRVVAALAATVLIASAATLVLFIGLGSALEEKCPQMAPPGATSSGGPYWVGPTTFRCDHVGAPDTVYSDATPLGATSTVLLFAAAATATVWYAGVLRPVRKLRTHT